MWLVAVVLAVLLPAGARSVPLYPDPVAYEIVLLPESVELPDELSVALWQPVVFTVKNERTAALDFWIPELPNVRPLSLAPGQTGTLRVRSNRAGELSLSAGHPDDPQTVGALVVRPEVAIELGDFYFDPDELIVPLGSTVTIHAYSVDAEFPHNFSVRGLARNPQTGNIPSGQSAVLEFVADREGEFEFLCTLRGHRERGMFGKLIVVKAPEPAGGNV